MKRKEASLSTEIGERILFVSLRRNHLLAAVETGRADVVTTMHFTGRSFDSGGRVGQKVVSTVITALVGGFLVLLTSHGKPHVYQTSDITIFCKPALGNRACRFPEFLLRDPAEIKDFGRRVCQTTRGGSSASNRTPTWKVANFSKFAKK